MRYAIVIEEAGGNFSGYVPDLPGCVATGPSPHAVELLMKDAIRLHLDGLRADGDRAPPNRIHVAYVDIAA